MKSYCMALAAAVCAAVIIGLFFDKPGRGVDGYVRLCLSLCLILLFVRPLASVRELSDGWEETLSGAVPKETSPDIAAEAFDERVIDLTKSRLYSNVKEAIFRETGITPVDVRIQCDADKSADDTWRLDVSLVTVIIGEKDDTPECREKIDTLISEMLFTKPVILSEEKEEQYDE